MPGCAPGIVTAPVRLEGRCGVDRDLAREPIQLRACQGGQRPHGAHLGREAEGEIDGTVGVNLEEDDRACAFGGRFRRKHGLSYGECDMRVGDGGVVGKTSMVLLRR